MWNVINSNFWAAIAGAIVGGALTIIMQMLDRRSAKRERRDAQRLERQATATSIVSKLVRMHRQLDSFVRNHELGAAEAKSGQDPWAYVRAIGALPEPASLTSAEAASLLQLDANLFNEILLFADRYQVAVQTHGLYGSVRKSLQDKLSPIRMEGIVGEVHASDELERLTAPERAWLNDTAITSHTHNVADAAMGIDLLRRLVAKVNSDLGMSLKMAIPFIDATEQA